MDVLVPGVSISTRSMGTSAVFVQMSARKTNSTVCQSGLCLVHDAKDIVFYFLQYCLKNIHFLIRAILHYLSKKHFPQF